MNITSGELINIGILGKMTQTYGMTPFVIGLILCGILGYVFGSFNFALIISKWLKKDDIRNYGSGNAGMTNMLRTFGKGAAAGTLLGDAGKAALSALVGMCLCGEMGKYIAGLFCIIGHVFPLFFKFKGGKGVVTTYVMILCLNPIVFLIIFLLFVAIVAITKYLSLGSIMCMAVYPLLLHRMSPEPDPIRLLVSIFIALFVIYLHRGNIERLLNRTESKFTLKTKGSKNEKKAAEANANTETENKEENKT
nr:glycerol-3-phosphate 1-O-acyltransferase PlsY [Clostridia bacterium]